MAQIFPIDFDEKLTIANGDFILFSDSEDGNKIKKAQYSNLKGEQGDPGTPGADGLAATITVGSTTTGTPGSSASVTNSGTSSAAVLDFTIPQGAKGEPGEDGDDGAAATITVGTTTTLPAGSSATVTNVGTSQDAILNFGIPKGDSGTGSGDVLGPASSTDGHLAVFDGTTGKIIKDGGAVPTVPTKVSDLTNDSGFLTSSTGVTSVNGSHGTVTVNEPKVSATAPSNPTEGMLWYDTTNDVLKVYDGNQWNSTGGGGGGDVQVSTDTGNLLSAGAKLWIGTESDFSSIVSPDSNTMYIQYVASGGGWTPGANTIAYYPLKSGVNDGKGSGTLYNLTNSGIIFGDLGGVTCANFNGSAYASGSFYAYGTGNFTASVWGYPTSNNQGVRRCIGVIALVMNSKDGYVEGTSAPTPLNTWTNIVFTISGGKLKIYSNGTLYLDTNFSNNLPGTLYLGENDAGNFKLNGGLSELIFEDKERTAQEVSDYYNLTKGNYGIS